MVGGGGAREKEVRTEMGGDEGGRGRGREGERDGRGGREGERGGVGWGSRGSAGAVYRLDSELLMLA